MIDKIFIPTVKRADNQITYNGLHPDLQKKVVFVVQAWERNQYHYDNEYLILPDYITLDHPRAIAETRKVIYEHAANMKYAVFDDDIIFYRRNHKYWTGESNMEKSKRPCEPNELLEMFDLFDVWLDEPDITLASCWPISRFPSLHPYENNRSIGSVYFINGPDFKHKLSEFDLTCVKIYEDMLLTLYLLTNGYGNRTSNEFIFKNESVQGSGKRMESVIWDSETLESARADHRTIEKLFPDFFHVLYDKNGNQLEGGYRDFGKVRIECGKAYRSFFEKKNSLMNFL